MEFLIPGSQKTMVDLGKGKNERVLSIYTELQNGYLVEAEVFGDGIDMWMKGQGESIKVV